MTDPLPHPPKWSLWTLKGGRGVKIEVLKVFALEGQWLVRYRNVGSAMTMVLDCTLKEFWDLVEEKPTSGIWWERALQWAGLR